MVQFCIINKNTCIYNYISKITPRHMLVHRVEAWCSCRTKTQYHLCQLCTQIKHHEAHYGVATASKVD